MQASALRLLQDPLAPGIITRPLPGYIRSPALCFVELFRRTVGVTNNKDTCGPVVAGCTPMDNGRELCISPRSVKVREHEGGACQVNFIFGCFKILYVPCTCH